MFLSLNGICSLILNFFPEIHRKANSRKEKKATRGQTTKGKGSKREEAKA